MITKIRRKLNRKTLLRVLPVFAILAIILSATLFLLPAKNAKAAAGDIGAVIDSLEYDTSAASNEQNQILVSAGVVAIAHRDADGDGWIKTYSIDASGNIGAAVIDSLEYDTASGITPWIVPIATTKYAIFYTSTPAGKVCTIDIQSNGTIGDAIIDSHTFEASQGDNPTGLKIAGTVYAVAYTGPDNDGWLKTLNINDDGSIDASPEIDNWEWDTSGSGTQFLRHVSGTVYAIGGHNSGTDLVNIFTFSVADNGTITKSKTDTLNSTAYEKGWAWFDKASGTTWAVLVPWDSGGAGDPTQFYPRLMSMTISDAGAISNSFTDTLYLASLGRVGSVATCSFYRSKDTDFLVCSVGYTSTNTSIRVYTVSVDGVGGIGAVLDSLIVDAANGGQTNVVKAYDGIGVVSYVGAGSDGFVSSFDVDEGTVSPTVTVQAASSVEETTATLNGNITSTGGEDCDYRGFVYDTSTHADPGNVAPAASGYASNWTEDGTYGTGAFDHGLTSLTQGDTYYFRACAHNSVGWDYSNTEEYFDTKPEAPTSFDANTPSSTTIDLDWIKGTGAVNTYIRGKDGSYPADRADGYLVYDDTGTSTQDIGLTTGHTYYYRAWSWVSGSNYSDAYGEDNQTALGMPTVTVSAASSVEETTAILNGNITATGGENCDYRGFVYDTSTHVDPGDVAPAASGYASNWTESGSYGVAAYTRDLTSLTQGETYYVRACAHNSSGWDYSDTEEDFTTKPEAPSGLTTTNVMGASLTLSWTKGAGATNTYIRGKIGSAPAGVGDGDLVYNDTGATVNLSSLVYSTHYFYRAWSFVPTVTYSDAYDDEDVTTAGPPDPLDPNTSGQVVQVVTDDILDATADTDMIIAVTGSSEVTATLFIARPAGTSVPTSGVDVKYQDLFIDAPATVTNIDLRLYYTVAELGACIEDSLRAYWWDGDSWELCSDQTLSTVDVGGYGGYVRVVITAGTDPTLGQLNAREFRLAGTEETANAVYYIAATLPYVYAAFCILAILAMVGTGHAIEGLILAAVLAIIGIVGIGIIQTALSGI